MQSKKRLGEQARPGQLVQCSLGWGRSEPRAREGSESPTGAATPCEALEHPRRSLRWAVLCWGASLRDRWSGQGKQEAWPGMQAALKLGGQPRQHSHLGLCHHTLLEQAVQQFLRRAPGTVKESSRVWNPHDLTPPGGSLISGRGAGEAILGRLVLAVEEDVRDKMPQVEGLRPVGSSRVGVEVSSPLCTEPTCAPSPRRGR